MMEQSLPIGVEAISPYPHFNHNYNPLSQSIYIPFHITPYQILTTKTKLVTPRRPSFLQAMAAMNSSVLACSYAISGTESLELNAKLTPSVPMLVSGPKLPVIRAQQSRASEVNELRASEGRRAAMLCLAATLFTSVAASSANAGIIEDYLEKSKINKELNDKKRLATSGANFARAYTVEFGTCKFPENFTGCQDLAKQKKVPFLSDDIALECEGKDAYKCGSNVFWKGKGK